MPHHSLTIISNALLLCCCFIWNGSNGGWVQAVDNNSRFPRQQSLHIRMGSTNDARERRSLHLPQSSLGSTKNNPCFSPVYAPTAAPTSFTDTQNDSDEHNTWLLRQQQYAQEQKYQVSSTSPAPRTMGRRSKGVLPSFLSTGSLAELSQSILDASKAYTRRVHRESPTTFWTAASSIVIFLWWNLLPAMHPILMRYFLASRQSAKKSFGLSLVLSSVSHNSIRHLLVNIFVFLNLSPALMSIKVPSSSWASKTRSKYAGLTKASLWPFLVGGALSGNLLFLLFRRKGSCLGLSGVISAMLGAYACAVPERVMKIRVYGVVPVTLKMKTLVQVLLAVSLAGAVFMPASPTCHLGHLGGLLFGILYYQKMTKNPRASPSYAPSAAPTAVPTASTQGYL